MKRSLAFAFLLLSSSLAGATPYMDFETQVRDGLIKPFALDLGGLFGSLGFYTGRSLGMPGFEFGGTAEFQTKPDKNDLVMRNAGVRGFGLPAAYAAVGLPLKFDLAAHGMKAQGVSLVGGGLRYCAFKTGLATKFLPSVGFSAFGDRVTHEDFTADHVGLNAQASWDLPFVDPWVGAGLDSTRVKVRNATFPGVSGLSASATGSRFAAGLEVTPFPFLRIDAAYLVLHGVPGGRISAGVKF